MYGAIYAAEGSDSAVLEAVAREFSPRIEVCDTREITLDLIGVERLFGDGREVAAAIRSTAADRGLRVRVAIAGTRTAARLLAHHRPGISVIDAGTEASVLAPLPLALLRVLRSSEAGESSGATEIAALLVTLRQWGLRTLGEFVDLPADAIAARLGQAGVWWQRVAAGEDPLPLVPAVPEERFAQALELEWPIDGLEPLSFVLGRLMEPLERHLEQRDRGAAVLHVQLQLVKGDDGVRPVHERSLQLPTPIRDARTLRTLALLDLESHPSSAAIERVTVAVDPTPARIVQYSLLTRPLPSPEQVSTLMARLNALMGDGRCGAPAVVDSWRPGAFAMQPFNPKDVPPAPPPHEPADVPVVALRRFRLPIPARVVVEQGKPARVTSDRRGVNGGQVEQCAGPWRTSGDWWVEQVQFEEGPLKVQFEDGQLEQGNDSTRPSANRTFNCSSSNRTFTCPSSNGKWDRDEWDVTLSDGATYRVFRERDSGHWFLEGIVD